MRLTYSEYIHFINPNYNELIDSDFVIFDWKHMKRGKLIKMNLFDKFKSFFIYHTHPSFKPRYVKIKLSNGDIKLIDPFYITIEWESTYLMENYLK